MKLIPIWYDSSNVKLEIILKINLLNVDALSKLFFCPTTFHNLKTKHIQSN
jgi:hypothetical protein